MLDVTSSDHKPGFVDLAGQAIRSPAVKPTAGDPVPTPLCTASTPYMRREVVIWGDCVKLRCVAATHVSVWLWGACGCGCGCRAHACTALQIWKDSSRLTMVVEPYANLR